MIGYQNNDGLNQYSLIKTQTYNSLLNEFDDIMTTRKTMTDFDNKTPEELQAIIAAAQAQLEITQKNRYQRVIAEIKALAASIGITVEIQEKGKTGNSKPPVKVIPKYRHPDDRSKTWSGRGLQPHWLQTLINAGHYKEEFLVKRQSLQ